MKVSVLGNELNKFCEGKSGFSLLIEFLNIKILFDTSFENDVDLKDNNIDYLVISHGHDDHINGLKTINLSKIKNMIAHPLCFEKKYYPGEGEIGSPYSLDKLKDKTNLILSKEPYAIGKNIFFLGEIPQTNNFEKREPIGFLDNKEPDYIMEDSAIAVKTEKGLVIITGCSHSGICNIIEYGKQITNTKKVYAVIGGFHLFDKIKTDKTIEFFKEEKIEKIYPMHCLDEYAFNEFKKIGAKKVRKWDLIEL